MKRSPGHTSVIQAACLITAVCQGCIMGGHDCAISGGTVTGVLDGDTVMIDDTWTVRLLAIDAPETGCCWSARSHAAAEALLMGREVELEFTSRCTDDYGRLLAHVILDGRCASEYLASRGHACAWILQQDDERAGDIRHAAQLASSLGLGFWGACPEVTCRSR